MKNTYFKLCGHHVLTETLVEVPLMRNGGRRVYAVILALLFTCVNVNVGVVWYELRMIIVVHDNTSDSMDQSLLVEDDQNDIGTLVMTMFLTSIILADIILV